MSIKNNIYPRLTLVGTGPGDPGLITLKGVEAIETANVILYDASVDVSLLKYAHEDALKIFVGKRNNDLSYTLEQVNAMMVDHAFSYGHVVILSGDDNQVIARFYHTIAYAELFNIETDVIPGVSEPASIPELIATYRTPFIEQRYLLN